MDRGIQAHDSVMNSRASSRLVKRNSVVLGSQKSLNSRRASSRKSNNEVYPNLMQSSQVDDQLHLPEIEQPKPIIITKEAL